MYTHSKQLTYAGKPLAEAQKVLILLHGRGGSAGDLISIAKYFNLEETAIIAPQATNNSWYPYSFMAADQSNQPALDSSIDVLQSVVEDVLSEGLKRGDIYFAGFSQGACLTLEYIGRNADSYGGAVAFTGGLIGQQLRRERYTGNIAGTKVLITTGDPDPHVPVSRVEESAELLTELNADVQIKIYPGRPHTIINEEIDL